jgi:hypothetical protein
LVPVGPRGAVVGARGHRTGTSQWPRGAPDWLSGSDDHSTVIGLLQQATLANRWPWPLPAVRRNGSGKDPM